MAIKIDSKFFTQANKVFSGRAEDGLTAAVRAVLISQAKIAASAVSALTDNSGGAAADGTIGAIGNVTKAVLGTDDAVQKAAGETALGTARDALKEILAQANAIHAKVPCLDDTLTDSLGGTAADGTIGAITVNVSGVGASMMSGAGARTFFTALRNRIKQAVYHVNKVAVATGQTPLVYTGDDADLTVTYSATFAALSTDTGTAVSGSDTTDANATVLAADFNAKMQLVANAIKEMAAILNNARSATGGTLGAVAA